MVRFHWHVEDGLGAQVGPGQLVYLRDHGVLQAMVEIEMPGQGGPLEACMNIPQNYNTDSGVREVGVVLAPGSDASDWRGRLLSELAIGLARAGFLVMRCILPPASAPGVSEARRLACLEKTADAAATSPYARGVTRWLLAGAGGGARLAALAGPRLRSGVAGYVLLSYPLREELPATPEADPASGLDGAASCVTPDSAAPILALAAPVMFLSASADPGVSEAALVELGPSMAAPDVRSVVLQDVDPHYRTLSGKGPHVATLRAITATFLDFLAAAAAGRMDLCKLPRIWRGGAMGPMIAVSAAAGGGDGGKGTDRPPLQRPACFRPIPEGQLSPNPLAYDQPHAQPLLLAATGPGGLTALPYQLSGPAAQALAAQLSQRQATAAASGCSGGNQQAAAQLLTQQVLLQQAAANAAAQRRGSEQAEQPITGAAATNKANAAAAVATRTVAGGGGGGSQPQLLGLAQALSDPATAAQIAAALLRNSNAVQQQQQQQGAGPLLLTLGSPAAGEGQGGSGGGVRATAGSGAAQSLAVEALTSAIVQRMAVQQQQSGPGGSAAGVSAGGQATLVSLPSGAAGQLLAATLAKQQQQQQQQQQAQQQLLLQSPTSAANSMQQQQQIQQLLMQHQRQQQQQQLQQQRQQISLQLQEQLLQQQRQAMLLQGVQGLRAQAPLVGGSGGMLMLQTGGIAGLMGAAGVDLGQEGGDVDMADTAPS